MVCGDVGEGRITKKMEINKKIDVLEENELNTLGAEVDTAPEVPEGTPPKSNPSTIDEGEVKEFALLEVGDAKIQVGSCSIQAPDLMGICYNVFQSIKDKVPKQNGEGKYIG